MNRPIQRKGAVRASFLFLIIILSNNILYSLKLPNWVLNIPNKSPVKFAVGVSNNHKNKDIAEKKAFNMACFDLACQEKVNVEAKYMDVADGSFIYFESVLPDSALISYYQKLAKIIQVFSDKRYTYVLAATDSIEVDVEMVKVSENQIKKRIKKESPHKIYGRGLAYYVSAIGFAHAAIRARVNVCEQLNSRIVSISADLDFSNTHIISEKKNIMTVKGIRIMGYFVNYQTNEIVAYAEYILEEET
jgi:hypothetical protein